MYGFCDPSDVDALQERLSVCIDEVFSWMMSNRLQFNPSKTEVLWCSSARRQHQIPTGPIRVGDTSVQPVRTVRDLGVYTDVDVAMSAHVTTVVKACFAALRQIRSVRRSLTRTNMLTLVHALVVTKVDYCSSVLPGISGQLLQRLQSVFNAAASLVFSARKSEHVAESSRENSVPVRDDNGSAGHGSSRSTNLSVSHVSRVSTHDPLTHDFVFFRHGRDLRHSLSHNVSLIQLFLRSILWQ